MPERGTFETLLGEIGQALLPLREALRSPESFFAFLQKLGWRGDGIPAPLADLGAGLDDLHAALRKLLGDELNVGGSVSVGDGGASANVSADDVMRVVNGVRKVVDGIRALATAPDAAFPAHLVADGFKSELPRQLVNHLVIEYLQKYRGSLAFALRALGVIKARYVAPVGQRLPYVHYSFDLADVPTVLGNPALVLENAYGWGTPDFDAHALLSQIDNLLMRLHIDTRVEDLSTSTALAIEGATVDGPDAPVRSMLRGIVFARARTTSRLVADVRLLPLPANGPDLPGLALMPAFTGVLDVKMNLFEDIEIGRAHV